MKRCLGLSLAFFLNMQPMIAGEKSFRREETSISNPRGMGYFWKGIGFLAAIIASSTGAHGEIAQGNFNNSLLSTDLGTRKLLGWEDDAKEATLLVGRGSCNSHGRHCTMREKLCTGFLYVDQSYQHAVTSLRCIQCKETEKNVKGICSDLMVEGERAYALVESVVHSKKLPDFSKEKFLDQNWAILKLKTSPAFSHFETGYMIKKNNFIHSSSFKVNKGPSIHYNCFLASEYSDNGLLHHTCATSNPIYYGSPIFKRIQNMPKWPNIVLAMHAFTDEYGSQYSVKMDDIHAAYVANPDSSARLITHRDHLVHAAQSGLPSRR